MRKQDLIGQVAHIELPNITEKVITARVDTGAQTSAIWVSNIHKDDDGLHVCFLGNSEEHEPSQLLTFKKFSSTRVVSSNGLSEDRYKVKLLVVIGDRRIRAWFTLADRSKQTYPVLIGRNVLRGKFIVDVAFAPKLPNQLTDKSKKG